MPIPIPRIILIGLILKEEIPSNARASIFRRGYLEEIVSTDPYLEGNVSLPVEVNADSLSAAEQRAMLRTLKDVLEAYVKSNEKIGFVQKHQPISMLSLREKVEQGN